MKTLSLLLAAAVVLPAAYTERLLSIDHLARFRDEVVRTGSFSSYDRSGGNDDGFSGKYSFLRKEGDGLVIAELTGPGALTRIWTPTPTADPMEFYFDGESTPRLRVPFIDLFKGPLAGAGAGGYWTYAPLEFTKGIKVVLRAAKMEFYQINYVLYRPGTAVRTYRAGDTFQMPVAAAAGRTVRAQHVLAPGTPVTVFEQNRPGRIVAIRLGPPEAFAGGDRAAVLRIYWDGEKRPAVEVPAGDFFGYSFGRPAMRSLAAGTEAGWNFIRLPMPFNRAAKIELALEGGASRNVQSEVVVADAPREPGEGWFHALWRRENPTTPGVPFTFLDVQGRGHLVGAIQQSQGKETGQTLFFEGDDQAIIDGVLAVHGTGSEDFYNGGWYDLPGRWYGQRSLPFSGCLEYRKHLARTGAYRLLLADAYGFRRSLRLTIEHGGENNSVPADYTGVTYFYLDRPGGTAAPLSAARAVEQPESFVLVPGWQEPIFASSFTNATLAKVKEKIGAGNVRYLSLRQTGRGEMQGHFVAITADVPAAGRYAISLEGVAGPDAGVVQMRVDDQPVGEKVDFRAPARAVTGPHHLADLDLEAGPNQLYFGLVEGKGFDLVRIRCKRILAPSASLREPFFRAKPPRAPSLESILLQPVL